MNKSDRLVTSGRGTCKICGGSVDYRQMSRHLKKHIPSNSSTDAYHIIRVSWGKYFWMCLQVRSASTLAQLDNFLRFAWVECCGHLSHFIINDTFYDVNPTDMAFDKPKSMNYKISHVLGKGMSFSYEYDFGTTTTLDLKVIEANVPPIVPPTSKFAPVKLLAIHDPVKFVCDNCGADATKICPYCGLYNFGGLACDDCIKTHKCCVSDGEEIALPVVQSPRVGQCAYVGPPFT